MPAVHRTIFLVDVESFTDGRRSDPDRVLVRRELYRLLEVAFDRAGIRWAHCDREDRGDGVLVLASADVPKSLFAEALLGEIAAELRSHNDSVGVAERIRLRTAVHAGEVTYDEHGVVGRSVNLAFRLLEAAALKDALANADGTLASIASAWFFDEVVRHSPDADSAKYAKVRVTSKDTDVNAWLCLPDSTGPPRFRVRPLTDGRPAVPRQLPPASRQFVGRAAELRQLTEWQHGAAPVTAVIEGTAGVGKTALALHWAHLAEHDFVDGQLHIDLRGYDAGEPVTADQALHGFLLALGVGQEAIPASTDTKAAMYRSLLADRRVLVVLDNASSYDQVRPLLPAGPTCLALITSRRRLPGMAVHQGAHRIDLRSLSTEEAMVVLRERIGADRVTSERASAAELVELCARLPLALAIVSARIADSHNYPLRAFVQELGSERDRLDGLDLGAVDLNVRAAFSWSYDELSDPAKRMFRLLGLHPGPDISRPACVALLDRADRVRAALDELAAANLVDEPVPGRYRCHDLVHVYAAELAGLDVHAEERAAVAHAMLAHYLDRASTADRAIQRCRDGVIRPPLADGEPGFPPIRSYADGIAWFTNERAVLIELVGLAAEVGLPEYAWRLAWASDTFLRRSGRWSERAAVHHQALLAAQRVGDLPGQVIALRLLGPAVSRLGDQVGALRYLDAAIELLDQVDDPVNTVAAHLAFTRVLDAHGDHPRALEHATRAWLLVEDDGNRLVKGDVHTAMGVQWLALEQFDKAKWACLQALDHYVAVAHPEGVADVLVSLGQIEYRLGAPEQAADHYRRSLAIDRALGDRYWEAHTLERLAEACVAAGDATAAIRHRRHAERLRRIIDPSAPAPSQFSEQ